MSCIVAYRMTLSNSHGVVRAYLVISTPYLSIYQTLHAFKISTGKSLIFWRQKGVFLIKGNIDNVLSRDAPNDRSKMRARRLN